MLSRSIGRSIGPVVLALVVLIAVGCDSPDDPELTGLISRDYEESFEVANSFDKLYVLVGTSQYEGENRPASVTVVSDPDSGESLRFSMRVVGLTLDASRRAITGYSWSNDTLRVWCGYNAPAYRSPSAKSQIFDPWQPPYLIPVEVVVGAPADVEVEYLGLWYE
jgi:hypothetical protein